MATAAKSELSSLGAFPLSDSALLDGRGAVTHWAAAPLLQRRRAAVQVDARALARTRLGSAAANTLARRLVVAPHRDGDEAQFVQRPVPDPGGVGRSGRRWSGRWPSSTVACPSTSWRGTPG